jgi:hypothetical protein
MRLALTLAVAARAIPRDLMLKLFVGILIHCGHR